MADNQLDGSFIGQSGDRANELVVNTAAPIAQYAHYFVRVIKLRGTGWDGSHHQELMIYLQGDTLLRISRNNGSDTFQLAAHKSKYNTLVKFDVSQRGITCADVLRAFSRERRAHPGYDDADCRSFAQNIVEELVPEAGDVIQEASGGRGSNLDELRDLFG
jgi:hypothetical protein